MKYCHIIWDWNGTLIDDMPLALNIVNSMLARRQMKEISKEQYLDLFEHPVANFYTSIGFNLDHIPYHQLTKEFGLGYETHSSSCELHSGALQALKELKKRGASQSILSASHQHVLKRNVVHHRIINYFSELVGLDNFEARSKVEQGRQWIKRLQFAPQEVVVIGDTTHDYEVAKELGCDCLLVSHGHQSEEKLKTTGVPVYNSLGELCRRII